MPASTKLSLPGSTRAAIAAKVKDEDIDSAIEVLREGLTATVHTRTGVQYVPGKTRSKVKKHVYGEVPDWQTRKACATALIQIKGELSDQGGPSGGEDKGFQVAEAITRLAANGMMMGIIDAIQGAQQAQQAKSAEVIDA